MNKKDSQKSEKQGNNTTLSAISLKNKVTNESIPTIVPSEDEKKPSGISSFSADKTENR